jgi:hypothetical protein
MVEACNECEIGIPPKEPLTSHHGTMGDPDRRIARSSCVIVSTGQRSRILQRTDGITLIHLLGK